MKIVIDWPDDAPLPTGVKLYGEGIPRQITDTRAAEIVEFKRRYIAGQRLQSICNEMRMSWSKACDLRKEFVPPELWRGKGWRYGGQPEEFFRQNTTDTEQAT